MRKVPTTVARSSFADLINRAAYGKERVTLTRRGKPLVAIVPFEDLAQLEAFEKLEDEVDAKAVRKAWTEQGDEPLANWETVKRQLGIDRRRGTSRTKGSRPAPRARADSRSVKKR